MTEHPAGRPVVSLLIDTPLLKFDLHASIIGHEPLDYCFALPPRQGVSKVEHCVYCTCSASFCRNINVLHTLRLVRLVGCVSLGPLLSLCTRNSGLTGGKPLISIPEDWSGGSCLSHVGLDLLECLRSSPRGAAGIILVVEGLRND